MRDKKELVKRYLCFLLGVFFNALGVALITKSMLGTGPTTCIPYVISEKIRVSYGICTFGFNAVLFLLQLIILNRRFPKQQFLQLPVSLLFSAFIDLSMAMCSGIPVNTYFMAIALTLFGCVLRGLGVSCQVVADVVMLPSESFVKALSVVSRKEFSLCKLISDATMTAIAAVLSFVFWGELFGIREGTVITVILVGPISKIFTRRLGFTKHYFEHEGELVYEKKLKLQKEKPLIVTITSEAGSGGRDIARILGEKLNIPVYDKELIEMVAKEGDFKEGYVRRHNEVLYANPFQAFFLENYSLANENVESYRKLYETQCSVIRQLAAQGDCIIVGHCSNYVLKNMADECCCVHILIGTDLRHRTEYMMKKYDISEAKALHRIRKQDTDTDVYYRHFTGINWKENGNYHLTIDSAAFGYEGTADVLDSIVRKRYMELPQVKIRETIRKYHRDE